MGGVFWEKKKTGDRERMFQKEPARERLTKGVVLGLDA